MKIVGYNIVHRSYKILVHIFMDNHNVIIYTLFAIIGIYHMLMIKKVIVMLEIVFKVIVFMMNQIIQLVY